MLTAHSLQHQVGIINKWLSKTKPGIVVSIFESNTHSALEICVVKDKFFLQRHLLSLHQLYSNPHSVFDELEKAIVMTIEQVESPEVQMRVYLEVRMLKWKQLYE